MNKNLLICLTMAFFSAVASARNDNLRFNPEAYTTRIMNMPNGESVKYKAYEGIYYVANVEDSVYQKLNIYVPENIGKGENIPILLRTYVGGYMASKAKALSATDATGRALKEGYVVCIPGSRGSNSVVRKDGTDLYTGTAPNGLLDLKAAVRYLHYNDDIMPGNADLIFTDGTSAGGAMSALLGITSRKEVFDSYLEMMGATHASDEVFASICYCPITDLEHADCEYEWLYQCTNDGVRKLDSDQNTVSEELASFFPDCLTRLDLYMPDGTRLTADNYLQYLKSYLIESAQKALQEGADIPDSIGVVFYDGDTGFVNDGTRDRNIVERRDNPPLSFSGTKTRSENRTDFVVDIDMERYLEYVASVTPLKTPPAFDQFGVLGGMPSPENKVFGNSSGFPANFTEYSLLHSAGKETTLDADIVHRIYLMNPMNFIDASAVGTATLHWYIRHGALDRDTSFLVPVNLATKLKNSGFDVDFALSWNRLHSGDYNLDDLFLWIKKTIESR